MSNYAHVQAVFICQYSVAQMCTHKDALAHSLGAPCLDDGMSYNSLTSLVLRSDQLTLTHYIIKEATPLFRTSILPGAQLFKGNIGS